MATSKIEKARTAVAVGDSPRPFFFLRQSANERDPERVAGNRINAQPTGASAAEDENLTIVCVDGEWMPEIELLRRGYEPVEKCDREENARDLTDGLKSNHKGSVNRIGSGISEGLRKKAIRIMQRPARRTWRW